MVWFWARAVWGEEEGDGAVYGCGELLLGVRDDDERLVAVVSTWRDFVLRGAKWVLVGSRDMGRCLYYALAHVRPTNTMLRLLYSLPWKILR